MATVLSGYVWLKRRNRNLTGSNRVAAERLGCSSLKAASLPCAGKNRVQR
jgi:hypothetical protein